MTLLIRPARPEDKPAVLELTRDIWEGHDYLPRVFDAWVQDPTSHFYVVEVDDTLAGLGRVSFPDPGEAWLEGGRVHPKYQGLGLAGILFAYQMYVVRQSGVHAARFCTASDNAPVHHLAKVHRFRRLADALLWEAPAGGTFEARLLDAGELPAAWEFIQGSPWYRLTGGLLCEGWVWRRLTQERLAERQRTGQVWVWPAEGTWRGLLIASVDLEYGDATCGFIAGEQEAMTRLAASLRAWAEGCSENAEAVIPEGLDEAQAAFEAGGYVLHAGLKQSLFERRFHP
ncbi:MAG: GNAT family N-acetyltransferase [Anaerolineae bacterium]